MVESHVEVHIRDVEDDDVRVFFDHQLDPEATRMAAFPSRERAPFEAHWAKIRADPTNFLRTIVVDGRVAGNVVSWEQLGKRFVGYWIGRDHWGRGVATKALALFLGGVKVRPLYADVAAHNVGSIRVLEKCGFQPIAKQHTPPAPDDTAGTANTNDTGGTTDTSGAGEVGEVELVLEI